MGRQEAVRDECELLAGNGHVFRDTKKLSMAAVQENVNVVTLFYGWRLQRSQKKNRKQEKAAWPAAASRHLAGSVIAHLTRLLLPGHDRNYCKWSHSVSQCQNVDKEPPMQRRTKKQKTEHRKHRKAPLRAARRSRRRRSKRMVRRKRADLGDRCFVATAFDFPDVISGHTRGGMQAPVGSNKCECVCVGPCL